MAVYAVGDLQGCLDPLLRLLDKVTFDPTVDRLWLVGDLVNRGPQSLECLEFVRDLGDAAVCVLGNHDLHLLAVHYGLQKSRRRDTVDDILFSPRRGELMDWLRRQSLIHHDESLGWTMVHAGLPPQWDLATALEEAAAVERLLAGPEPQVLLGNMYSNQPALWDPERSGWDRLRFTINCCTRMRYCDKNGELDLDCKDVPGDQPKRLMPWFAVPGRASRDLRLVVGHWSTLGYGEREGVLTLDTGCVWGRSMTLVRLDKKKPKPIQTDCAQALKPRG
ncbi:Bis(5'nucleosyl)-tetraphosphatase, ApaH [Ectothiorhodosinus mongolicus]|uniref:Bis(5'-nucleosyl)-tetraphosphatase, symmetrical n=1 Tax=Ectothiorhodosinus mongolicus TaxID=233100 RepID=A0A1R3W3A8_9GAMM|nr:symmetrical bis(5'-nucleosyl)-tetraphosphatase [Ectothiorhodosinus mongolicus]ULX57436.1 symmetrical bis(5'-nucleosyl)-tetraphosphatase [Ectothiorhodosinus mongolicus]SIT72178.1 Bis(5'nucleosyl)-tetraphosphatase, ApaH [Ectothiorhodosinus mongolicus]